MANDHDDARFRFSASVEAFYQDPAVQSAVDLLVNKSSIYAPESVAEWAEAGTFYDACLAARQTQIEFAKDLYRLWQAVWSEIPEDWTPVTADPGNPVLSLDPVARWETEYFERHFKLQNGKTVALWVTLGDEGRELDDVQMAFDVRNGEKSLIKSRRTEATTELPGWKFVNQAMRLSYGQEYGDGLDLNAFREGAEKVVSFIDSTDW